MTSEVFEFFPPGKTSFGGFSGLWFEGKDQATGELQFTTTTDRGPNLEATTNEKGESLRPFVDPKFRVQWLKFRLNLDEKMITLAERVELSQSDGRAISGLPNLPVGEGDEIGVDINGIYLKPDPMGLDTESLARDADGSYWMGEEYRPSVLHLTAQGRLLSRWVPEGTGDKYGQPLLPAHLLKRRLNRGFEGIAVDEKSVYAFLQSGLKGEPDVSRIEQIDKATGKPQATLIYPFDTTPAGFQKVDKIGDAVSIGHGQFYVIEQNGSTNETAYRRIYKIDIRGATNLLQMPERLVQREELCEGERKVERAEVCLLPVRKQLVADLTELGLREADKAEGLAVVDEKTLAVVNDNDFSERPSRLILIHLPSQR